MLSEMCRHPLCLETLEHFCCNCDTPFCSDHGTEGGDHSVDGIYLQAYPSRCWKCGGYNADEDVAA